MTTSARIENVHVSPRKAGLVCALIRGKKVSQALVILQNCPQKTARVLEKLLASAIANATNNHSMNGDKLYVYSCVANTGRTIKRAMPRAKGSSNMIRKRHSHLVIVLSDNANEKQMALKAIKAKKTNKVKKPAKPASKPEAKPAAKPEVKKESK
ncbi:MAG: 50S ribosomal protein L22 [Mycoplasmoidaceae bacterium]|nr:50S ribosomal protein L22 [Mycoplasmoidaceae bacterium]